MGVTEILIATGALGTVCWAIISGAKEALPDGWLTGYRTQLAAVAVASLMAWGIDYRIGTALLELIQVGTRTLNPWLDYIITGAASAAPAGAFADWLKARPGTA